MHDRPESADLLAVVAAFIRNEAVPQLAGSTQYQARIAAHVIERAARELEQPADLAADEHRRLSALVGAPGDTRDLTHALCARIAAGEADLDTPGLADYLWTVTFNKLAVDQPNYAGYRRARREWDMRSSQNP